MDRRDFLKAVAVTGAAMTLRPHGAMDVLAQPVKSSSNGTPADLIAVMGGEPDEMLRRALTEVGGIGRFVKKGQKVLVKPNIGWDKTPELAGNTNPKLITELIRQCFAAGASEVTVFDHTCDDWRKCYQSSGIEEAAKAAGAKVVPAHTESYYREVSLPHGKNLKKAKIHTALLYADVWFICPILKNH